MHGASSSALAELICTRIVTVLCDETVRCSKNYGFLLFNRTVPGADLGDSRRKTLVKEGRQNRCATSGKRLLLGIGFCSACLEIGSRRKLFDAWWCLLDKVWRDLTETECFWKLPCAMNCELGTGANTWECDLSGKTKPCDRPSRC